MISRVIIMVAAFIGALAHAKLSQAQSSPGWNPMQWSRRVWFDIGTTIVAASLIAPFHLDQLLIDRAGLKDWGLPGLLELPYEAMAGVVIVFGYFFSSLFPNLLVYVASFLKTKFGVEITLLPDSGVIVVAKPRLIGAGDGTADPARALVDQTTAAKNAVVDALYTNEAQQLQKLNKAATP